MASLQRTKHGIAAALGLLLLWSYWPVLCAIAARWSHDQMYSHGYLVPAFSLWLLWKGLRQAGPNATLAESSGTWWGLAFLLPAIGLHLLGAYVFMEWLSEASLLIALVGLCLCVGGWRFLRVAGPAIGFLVFMLPLPYRVEVALALPLRHLATVASTYLLEMVGVTATAEGNIIVLNNGALGVAEACNGLGMLVTFFAIATAVAIVLDRPLLDRLVVVASAVPVALAANVVRITVTGVLYETIGAWVATVVYHDLAGYIILMPVAFGLIWLELKVLSRLLVAPLAPVQPGIGLTFRRMPPPVAGRRRSKVPVSK
jgi:exosortase